MKKIISIALMCIILATSCLLSSCKATALEKEDDGGFRNPKTDIVYYPASPNYLAKPHGSDAYARIEVSKDGEDFQLYQIEGLDPETYLVSNAFTVYCAAGSELPALADFVCDRVGIYDTQVGSNDGNIIDPLAIAELKELHQSKVFVDRSNITLYIWLEELTDDWYDLHFMGSGKYQGIYYQLKYLVCSEDIIITEIVEDPNNFVDFYPGIPYELTTEIYDDEEYHVAKYNFGREIMCDVATGNCYKVENSLLAYITPVEDTTTAAQ